MEPTRFPQQSSKINPEMCPVLSLRVGSLICDVWCLESTCSVCVCVWCTCLFRSKAYQLFSHLKWSPPAFRVIMVPGLVPARSNKHVHVSLFADTLHMHSQHCLHINQDTSYPSISQLQTCSQVLSRGFCFWNICSVIMKPWYLPLDWAVRENKLKNMNLRPLITLCQNRETLSSRWNKCHGFV